jgi:hypothetical protein
VAEMATEATLAGPASQLRTSRDLFVHAYDKYDFYGVAVIWYRLAAFEQ